MSEPADHIAPLGKIYTLQEVSAYLRLTSQAISRLARRHGPLRVFGREIRFSEADIVELRELHRATAEVSRRPAHPTRLGPDKAFSKLVALASKKNKRGRR